MLNITSFDFQLFTPEILNISGLGVIILDENHQIVASNGQFAQWLGKNSGDLVGINWLKLPLEASDLEDQAYYLFGKSKAESLHLHHWSAKLPSQPKLTAHYFLSNKASRKASTILPFVDARRRPSWVQFLEYEVSRSRRYDSPLAVLKVKLLDFESNDCQPSETANAQVLEVLKDELRWADMVGHSETGEFLVVLPETPKASLPSLKQKITHAIFGRFSRQAKDHQLQLVIGDAYWKKGDSSSALLENARIDLVRRLEALAAEYG